MCGMQAWDTLFWFAVLVGMSGQLNSSGVIKYFADVVGGKLTAMNLGWQPVFGLLNLSYFGLHYMFASQTAHVGALYAAFLAMMLSAGVLNLPATCESFREQVKSVFACAQASAKLTTTALYLHAVGTANFTGCRIRQECCCFA